MLRIVEPSLPPMVEEKAPSQVTDFVCAVCGHKVTVYNDGVGVEAFCWHFGTKYRGRNGGMPLTMIKQRSPKGKRRTRVTR